MNAYESKWYCELKELPVSEIDVDVKAKSYQMHCGRCMSHRGLKPYSVNLCKDINSLRLSVLIYRDGRALYHVWESDERVYTKNLMFCMIEIQIAVVWSS